MRASEFITEGREAPLYHFTSEGSFFRILATDTIKASGSIIYFTRDYGRQFVPANILAGSWGFRVNQDLLRQRFGRRLQAGGQNAWSEKERQAWLADPKNADIIKNPEQYSGYRVNGTDVKDIIAGTIGSQKRWESEEHLNAKEVPNFHEYLTGLVYAGGKANGGLGSGNKFYKRGVDSSAGLDKLSDFLMGHFKGEAGFKQRDALVEYMTKFNIPFVYQRQDFPAKQVKQRMIELWRERKAERNRRAETDNTTWTMIKNPQGGGLIVTGPSNIYSAARQALNDYPHKFPNGILGAKKNNDPKITWFQNPFTDSRHHPNISMGDPTPPPPEYQQNAIAEDISRRGFLKGLGGAAVAAAGLSAQDATGAELKKIKVVDNPKSRLLYDTAKPYIKGTELAQFMAQCAHETANFSTLVEFGGPEHFQKYDPQFNPKKAQELGNTQPGDGEKYKGRGFLQITGRDNYKRIGHSLKLPLEQKPEMVENPDVAAWTSVWYWIKQVRDRVHNFSNTKQATKPINPGLRGLKDREKKFANYQAAIAPPPKDKHKSHPHDIKVASK